MKKLKVFAITRNDDGAHCDTKKETVSDSKKEEMEAGDFFLFLFFLQKEEMEAGDKSEGKRVGGG